MNASASPQSSFSIARILMIVIPVGLIALGVLGYIRFGDELGLTGNRIPQVVTVEGKVMMRGKPLTGGTVQTIFSDNPSLMGGFGQIKSDGTFTLETAVEGDIQQGLFVGNHKVLVYNYLESVGAAQGPLTTPVKYSTAGQTPLTIEVTTSTSSTPLELTLEADEDTPTEEFIAEYKASLDERREASAGMAAGRPSGPPADNNGPAGAGGGGRGGFDPAAFFDEQDSDDNGVLAGEEIPERMKDRMEEIDTNQDGEISKEEFESAPRPQRGGPGGGRGGPGGGRGGPGGGPGAGNAGGESANSESSTSN